MFNKKKEEEKQVKLRRLQEESIDFTLKRWDHDLQKHNYHYQQCIREQKQMEIRMMSHLERIEELETRGVKVKNLYLENKKGINNIINEQKVVLDELNSIDSELEVLLVKNKV
eukprot:CAMPEP_0170545354 /NCGR_PEP_ID=MMETSP0211-20121228/3771_1 /TAXON_ID=311385 /ORGANISM="Pseudokeronopsis sp., Strain OXSARD2" /LENGTH=112 /DNA_ID=CAMNT_0010849233 /DNA_START=1485 /DNA_END=1823 /DNA_ORIENTATION=-